MTGFATRIKNAAQHETAVLTALRARGWQAEMFGQGQLTNDVRGLLRRCQTPVRWMPDIITGRVISDMTLVAFIDAKAGEKWRETGNHDIEDAALTTAEKWEQFTLLPLRFVFTDWTVVTPKQVRDSCWQGAYRGNGSGTPFVLFPADTGVPFDSIFGKAAN